MAYYMEFEKPIEALELKIEELRQMSTDEDREITSAIQELEKKVSSMRTEIFSNLTRWQRTQIARHPDRPYTLDYINLMTEGFVELKGDRAFADDLAIVGGLGRINGQPFVIIGHQKGRGVKERIQRNFGQPHPEGYRKAIRLMEMASRFKLPILTLIDTPGAYPGIGAEERGQGEAIASNLLKMSRLRTPIISVVIGEGGSGGALALGVSDRLYMLEHSTYSVISPEGCASILWAKEGTTLGPEYFAKAADALKLAAPDLLEFGVIQGIIAEPMGGAHQDPRSTAERIKLTVIEALAELKNLSGDELIEARYEALRKIGRYAKESVPTSDTAPPDPEDEEDAAS